MNLARKLHELQSLDVQVKNLRDSISKLNSQITDTSAIDALKSELDSLKKGQAETAQKHRDLDYEVEELQKNISKLSEKLYGGKVGNPKELMSIEQESDIFKGQLKTKEDELLEMMNEEEITGNKIKALAVSVEKLEKEKQETCKELTQKRDSQESQLAAIESQRQQYVATIDANSLAVYEGLKSKKGGQVVVRVEQGRCQGCRINLSMNESQRVRTGAIVQCSSCGKILFLE
jgi:uncharacterized protein